jgi:hypothetical protein
MAPADPADPAGPSGAARRLARSVRAADWKGRVKQAAQTLKDEYQAGKRGDDAPAQPIWASPKEQLDGVLGLLRSAAAMVGSSASGSSSASGGSSESGASGESGESSASATTEPVDEATIAADAEQVAEALRGVDWTSVSAAAAERTNDAARTVKAMADQVDWAKVQPVAAQVSSALIAAVASGQLGVGGRFGSTVARAIVDQGGLGQQVAKRVNAQQLAVPNDLRRIIDSTAREA